MTRSIRPAARWLLGALPTLAVMAMLAYASYEGHARGWQWSRPEAKAEKKAEEPTVPEEADDAEEALGFSESAFDPTLPITHAREKCRYVDQEIEFKDADAVRRAGIRLGIVRERTLDAMLAVTATADFDPTRLARVSSRAGGVLRQIGKQVGEDVFPGEVLAIVDAAEVGRAKSAFFQAKVNLDLKQQLRDRLQTGVSPEKSIIEADSALREARAQLQTSYQTLLNLGLAFRLADVEKFADDQLLKHLQFLGLPKEFADTSVDETSNNLLAATNPLRVQAVVLQRDGVIGEAVTAGQPIFVVGDTTRMLLWLDIRQEDRGLVKAGQKIQFQPDGDSLEPISGVIDSLSQDVDPKTRTAKARAIVDNKEGRLRAHAYGKAQIFLKASTPVLTVPVEAIQWEGCCHIVFVREEKSNFKVKRVTLGLRREGYVEIVNGVKAGDVIAVLGSHVLKSYLFRDRLGEPEE